MPNILIKIPQGAFNAQQRERILHEVTQVALEVEQIGEDPRQRALCWVLLEELAAGTGAVAAPISGPRRCLAWCSPTAHREAETAKAHRE